MWKLYFTYRDGGKCIVTGKGKEATADQLEKYTEMYANADSAVYKKYPIKENEIIKLW